MNSRKMNFGKNCSSFYRVSFCMILLSSLLMFSFLGKTMWVMASEVPAEVSSEISPETTVELLGNVNQQETQQEEQQEFERVIDDAAEFFTQAEKECILGNMKQIATISNVAMLTRLEGNISAKEYCDKFHKEHWSGKESVIFMIDMEEGVIRTSHYVTEEPKITLEDPDFQKIIDEVIGDVNDSNYGKAAADYFKKLSFMLFGETFEDIEKTSEQGYEVIIFDQADLLTEEQQESLIEVMEPIAAYGHVVLLTTDKNEKTARELCRDYFDSRWDKDSALIFLIDMDNRVIRLESFGYGQLYDIITEAYGNTITDNVYKYAKDQDYYQCAKAAFTQTNSLLEGKKIAQPMKYICNALLALILSVFAIFIYVRMRITQKAPAAEEMLDYINYYCNIEKLDRQYLRKEKVYHNSHSGSSGGSGSSDISSNWSSSGSSSSSSSYGGSSSSSGGSSSTRSHGGEHRF